MSNSNEDDENVNDSTNERDIVEDSTNVQPRISVGSTSQAEDAATDAQSLLPSLPPSPTMSPPPSAPQSPRPPRRMLRPSASQTAAAPPPCPPPPPMPFGPFMMPAGEYVPPLRGQPMMMPPHPYFQFAPYGQSFVPCGYTMIPYPPNPWETGPFDCFSDAKNCCLTCSCPCVTFGQIAEILNEGQTPWWEHAAGYLVLESITFSVGTFLYAWPYRAKMRTKFWLGGKLLWDFIFTFFCTRVSLCQQYRQLSRLGFDVALGWEANREKMRLKALENMYQMQNRQVTPPAIELGMHR